MWYAIAAIVAIVSGAVIWAVVRSAGSGQARAERDALKEAAGARRKGDAVMSEPVADEDEWLAAARKRLRRLQDNAKP